ncbi:hypothetical protein [Anaeromyxobacter paludicola]|uniref:Cell division protein FtsK n=1 Tax=Anaeromyxobacter paludicola TaxID=2918171 RepID=A0ABN6N2N4_9BACT|nr:hypothetical protein [Anaeromyxobacter paludicola]BDG07474.1 hypothetical protein AMPC_05870 [Anaeromyxobacter paludicola]
MRVYGDRLRREAPREKLARLGALLGDARAAGGRARHDLLLDALVEAGELAQGVLDARFAAEGADGRSPEGDAAMALAGGVARALWSSWRSGFSRVEWPPGALALAVARAGLPATVEVKAPEGYAFYALYPEAYGEAAEALAPAGARLRVIGLRSVGTGLAALVAAAAGATRAPVTLRPVGHPFARRLAVSAALERELVGDPEARYAVVDEGPGLSGSSFAAVGRWLEARGVAPERIHLLPGHDGEPGGVNPEAAAAYRRWPRRAVSFEALHREAGGIAAWAAPLIGLALEPPRDLSGGAWRALVCGAPPWPPADPPRERRKLLVRTRAGPWLLRFAGLGRSGAAALRRARALARAGFAAEVAGLARGFLVQRWVEARPLPQAAVPRAALLARVAEYLAFRAAALPAGAGEGAAPGELLEMARTNLAEGGEAAALRALEAAAAPLDAISAGARPIEVDGKLQPWEWLVAGDGRLLKADAVDHCAAHDLVGCQDLLWDVAGAEAELALSRGELGELLGRLRAAGARPEAHLAFYRLAYRAFQLGRARLAVGGP